MKRVYKYPLTNLVTRIGSTSFVMPEGAEILTIQLQHGAPQMWALIDDERPLVTREFIVVGTGWDIDDYEGARYVGTYQQHGGEFVWHLFELAPSPAALNPEADHAA